MERRKRLEEDDDFVVVPRPKQGRYDREHVPPARSQMKQVDRLRPIDKYVRSALQQVLVLPVDDDDDDDLVAASFVTQHGTATITIERSVIVQLGKALQEAALPDFVGLRIELPE